MELVGQMNEDVKMHNIITPPFAMRKEWILAKICTFVAAPHNSRKLCDNVNSQKFPAPNTQRHQRFSKINKTKLRTKTALHLIDVLKQVNTSSTQHSNQKLRRKKITFWLDLVKPPDSRWLLAPRPVCVVSHCAPIRIMLCGNLQELLL